MSCTYICFPFFDPSSSSSSSSSSSGSSGSSYLHSVNISNRSTPGNPNNCCAENLCTNVDYDDLVWDLRYDIYKGTKIGDPVSIANEPETKDFGFYYNNWWYEVRNYLITTKNECTSTIKVNSSNRWNINGIDFNSIDCNNTKISTPINGQTLYLQRGQPVWKKTTVVPLNVPDDFNPPLNNEFRWQIRPQKNLWIISGSIPPTSFVNRSSNTLGLTLADFDHLDGTISSNTAVGKYPYRIDYTYSGQGCNITKEVSFNIVVFDSSSSSSSNGSLPPPSEFGISSKCNRIEFQIGLVSTTQQHSYRMDIATNPGFVNAILINQVVNVGSLSQNPAVSVSPVSVGQTYYFRFRTVDSLNRTSANSQTLIIPVTCP